MTHFNTLKKKVLGKQYQNIVENVKLLKMSNFPFFHNVFYIICTLKSFHSHIPVIVSSFFEFVTVSKSCIRKLVEKKAAFKLQCSGNHFIHVLETISSMFWKPLHPYIFLPCTEKFLHVYLSHNNPCFQCNIAITNFLVSPTCEI